MPSSDKIDAIVIGQSEIVRYEEYSKLPLDRVELFSELVFLRMVHLEGGFRSHLDVLNYARSGMFYDQADYPTRRKLLNIWNLPGLSSLLVASAARHDGFNVKVINNFDSEWDVFVDYYDSQIEPPIVGISTTFYLSYAEIRRLCKKLRAHDPQMKIVLGGAHSNEQTINSPLSGFEAPMRQHGVSHVLHAFNSDVDFPHFLRAMQGKADIASVPNLAYLDQSGKFHLTEKKWHDPSLNSRPMLWSQVDLPFANRTVQLRAASGCPFACAFCTYPDTAGGHFAMELELIERQLTEIKALGYVERIIFIDDTFNVPIGRFREILRILCKFDFEWFSFLRVQYVDDMVARMMRDSGCKGVYLGIESGNDTVLKNMNKKVTREKFLKGMEHLNRYGINTFAAFVIGFPGETEETIADDIRFLNDCAIDFYSTKEFYYMQHAKVHQDREQYGLVGLGNKWKHNTMDAKTAAEMKIHMFKEIKSSIFIDPDISLWYLAYLYDQGFTFSQVKAIQTILNEMMLAEINGDFGDKSPAIHRLQQILRAQPATNASLPALATPALRA
jgi:p-methyltransferase